MMTPEWLSRSVSSLRHMPRQNLDQVAGSADTAPATIKKVAIVKVARTTRERLKATLRHQQEALSPRVLRRTLTELQAVVDPRVGELEGSRRARAVANWYSKASAEQRRDAWLLMSEQFAPDATKVNAAREQYEAALGTPEEGQAEIRLRRAFESPRTRLLQRFAAFPDGMRFLVDLRAELLPHLKSEKRLLALDAELETLFSTWFDVGFLELRRISWDSPASLIERLIKYEAVHDIKGWADLKNRLDSDRRCYGFFHPRMPDEPLIFVEVALMDEIADSITPLLDESAAPADLTKATTAIFYSISSTQPGLRGVSFGDSLIKRVVETLKDGFPKLKVFATLSPIPGFRGWLAKNAAAMLQKLSDSERAELGKALGEKAPTPGRFLEAAELMREASGADPAARLLRQSAAYYLAHEWQDGKPLDAVARFHLGNGALVQRLNWAADPSGKGWKQSYGMMVNYLYDLKRFDKHRTQLARCKIPVSREIENLEF